MNFDNRAGFGESETDTEDYEKIPEGPTDTKLNSYHDEAKQIGKDLEVGGDDDGVSPTTTNVSSLNSRVADENFSISPAPLSSLAECPENVENSISAISIINSNSNNRVAFARSYCRSSPARDVARSLSPIPTSQSRSACDGHHQHQQQQRQLASGSGGSSPSVDQGTIDFLGTEFYMDESLPSSLSEHPNDRQQQAIVSLLQVLGSYYRLAINSTRSS